MTGRAVSGGGWEKGGEGGGNVVFVREWLPHCGQRKAENLGGEVRRRSGEFGGEEGKRQVCVAVLLGAFVF